MKYRVTFTFSGISREELNATVDEMVDISSPDSHHIETVEEVDEPEPLAISDFAVDDSVRILPFTGIERTGVIMSVDDGTCVVALDNGEFVELPFNQMEVI